MKNIFTPLLLMSLLVCASYVQAEEQNKREKLIEKLALEPDQVETVETILNEQKNKRQEIKQKMKAEMESLHAETSQRLGEVLTAEQLQQFEQLHEQRRQKSSSTVSS